MEDAMATTPFDQIRSTALALSQSERVKLARELMASLDEGSKEPADAWDDEIQRHLHHDRSLRLVDRLEVKRMMRRHLPPK
jgi:putative addiction module component